jgi:alpha-tubulin suppressor-like RCC1 family protein
MPSQLIRMRSVNSRRRAAGAGAVAVVTALALALAGVPAGDAAPSSGDQLYAFGDNVDGELGNGSNTNTTAPGPTPTPVQIADPTTVAAGNAFTLVLNSAGQLYAFGLNTTGQLGSAVNNATTHPNPTPTPVVLPQSSGTVTQIAAGTDFSLAVTSSGQLYAFGSNSEGQLGNATDLGTSSANPTPTLVRVLMRVEGATRERNATPRLVPTLFERFVAVAAGAEYALAVTSTGQLYSWGADGSGQLGRAAGTSNYTPAPVSLPGATGPVTQIAAGDASSFAVTSTGQLYSFGDNQYGQLGRNTPGEDDPTPTRVSLPNANSAVTQVASGGDQTLVVTANHALWTFGSNEYGQLGLPSGVGYQVNPTPAPVPGVPDDVAAISAGSDFSLALTSTGQLYSFGVNYYGQLGRDTNSGTSVPNPMPTLVNLPRNAAIVAISHGPTPVHALVVASDLALATTTLASGRAGAPYGQTATAAGGTPPYTWSANGLPGGLSISSAGRISGTPTSAGVANVVLTVTDSAGLRVSSAPLTLTIAAATTTTTTTSSTSAPPSASALKASLRSQLAPHGSAAGIGALLKTGHYRLSFKALHAGTLTIDWYHSPTTGHAKPLLIAAGKRTFSATGTRTITITLTANGRHLLTSAQRVQLTARGAVTDSTTRVTASTTFTIKR